jgi:hypothetical protein
VATTSDAAQTDRFPWSFGARDVTKTYDGEYFGNDNVTRVHRVLPFWQMSVVLRAGLSEGLMATSVARAYVALGAWTVVSCLIAGWVVARRG